MKVFIVKYALTQGIYKLEVKLCDDINPEMVSEVKEGGWNNCFHGKGREWTTTREDAVKRAMIMRDTKVISLEKQIKKLKAMTFEEKA